MKTKPILITAAIVIVLAAGIFLLVRSKKAGYVAEKSEIAQFLNGFNNRIKEGNTDSLLTYFEAGKKLGVVKKLVNLLAGKNSLNGNDKPLFDFIFEVDDADVKMVNTDLVEAVVPARFTHDSLNTWKSSLTLKIKKVAPHQYKIVQVDARRFLGDYGSFENLVRNKTTSEKDIYSPITLEAFKTAAGLKTRYDSVIWFAHLDNKTWFYVVKGKWDKDKDINKAFYQSRDSLIEPYKMGLVNPDLKEIIPVEYDLIHNINATFDGMVEVEKDDKKGFYNLSGKLIVPVNYDQIFPIEDEANLAVLRNGNDYFYLKKDTTISGKADIKISDFFAKIKNLSNAYDLNKNALAVVTEINSKDDPNAVFVPPSYLAEMNIVPKLTNFKNPLRKAEYDDAHDKYEVKYAGGNTAGDNWLEASFYSIRDYFLGGRSEFYDRKNVVIIDKKRDRVFTQDIPTDLDETGGGSLTGVCDINSIKAINDSLFEIKSGALLEVDLYDSTKSVTGGPHYTYLAVKNNKLVELPDFRSFGFTKYVKMDDSYLNSCYVMETGRMGYEKTTKSTISRMTPDMLMYIKNEIFADYSYQFKDTRWQAVFADMSHPYRPGSGNAPYNVNVDDSLTVIDKYNINWITQKLKTLKASPANTLATR